MNLVFRSRYGQVVLEDDSVYIHESPAYKVLRIVWRVVMVLAAPALFVWLLYDGFQDSMDKVRLLFMGFFHSFP